MSGPPLHVHVLLSILSELPPALSITLEVRGLITPAFFEATLKIPSFQLASYYVVLATGQWWVSCGSLYAFAYKVDRRLSSALGEVESSHCPGESFLIDHQCPLWGRRPALPHVDLPPPASLSSSSVGCCVAALRLWRLSHPEL
jgi:hypothetical protein